MHMNHSAQSTFVKAGTARGLHLEKALQPPDLEHALAHQHAELEQAPPFHARVGRLGRVAVRALADDDVGLLVFDLGEEFGEKADCSYSSSN